MAAQLGEPIMCPDCGGFIIMTIDSTTKAQPNGSTTTDTIDLKCEDCGRKPEIVHVYNRYDS